MTGLISMMFGGSGVIASWSGDITDGQLAPTTASGSISIKRDGTITGSNYTGASKWFTVTGGTPGDSYYVAFTTDGNAWDAGLVAGTVYALTSNRSVSWSVSNGMKSGNLTVTIYSDSGGTNQLGVGVVTYDFQSTP